MDFEKALEWIQDRKGQKVARLDGKTAQEHIKAIEAALKISQRVNEYTYNRLTFDMGMCRSFAIKNASSHHHGAANSYEEVYGVLDEAIREAKK
jgi:hypothetical protein